MDFLNICRLCLAENLQLFSVFDKCDGTNVKLSEIIKAIAGSDYYIDEFDSLSKNICETCKSLCCEFVRFRETIVASSEYQQKSLQQGVNKEESQYEEIIINELDVDYEDEQRLDDEDNYTTLIEINTNEQTDELLIDELNNSSYDFIETASSDDSDDDSEEEQEEAARMQCTKCSKSFTSKRKLNAHMKMHATRVRLHECKVCKRKFTSEIQLSRHEIIHSDLITQIKHENAFQCIVCKSVAADKHELDDHIREHRLKMESENIECIHCNKSFDKFNGLVRHLKKHDENKTHLCTVCNKSFALGQELIDHLNRHKGNLPYTCHICGKSYLQLSKLKIHLETHSDEKSFLCTECGKSFTRNSNLRQHLLRHTGNKKYQCNQCPAKFISKGNLKAHMTTHSNKKPYKCEICGSSFTQSYSLVKHNRIHTGTRPFPCDVCEMRFYSSDHLKRHVRTHTGEKPYKCNFCSKSFAQNGDLNKHKRIHIGENTYMCDFPGCKDAFRLLSELRAHHKVHYGREDDDDEMAESDDIQKVFICKDKKNIVIMKEVTE